jgi:hypothetical protein
MTSDGIDTPLNVIAIPSKAIAIPLNASVLDPCRRNSHQNRLARV